MTTLGMRLNNPGLLRDTGVKWEGRVGSKQGFVEFQTMAHGVRALVLDAMHDRDRKGMDTLSKLIAERAPPTENNTAMYISNVSDWMGIDPDAVVSWTPEVWYEYVVAISRQENSEAPPDNAIVAGLNLAGVQFRRSRGNSRTIRNGLTSLGAGGLTLAGITGAFTPFASATDWRVVAAAGVVAMMLLTLGIIFYRLQDRRDYGR